MNTYSAEIKETIFSEDNIKKIKKDCCLNTIFFTILSFKDFQIGDDDITEIKVEEKVINYVFEHCLKKLHISYEKALIVNEKKSMIFFSFHNKLKPNENLNHCCRYNLLKTSFLCGGYISNPEKNYHLEILSYFINNIEQIKNVMIEEELEPKYYIKNQNTDKPIHVLYIKKSEEIAHFLGLIGAHKQVLDFENMRIEKDFKNKINRQVNYESANIEKTISSAVKYIKYIEWAIKTGFFNELSDELKEVALLRLNNPEHNLRELCDLYNNTVTDSDSEIEKEKYQKTYEAKNKFLTKSGINHRLRKLYVIIHEEINKSSKVMI